MNIVVLTLVIWYVILTCDFEKVQVLVTEKMIFYQIKWYKLSKTVNQLINDDWNWYELLLEWNWQ